MAWFPRVALFAAVLAWCTPHSGAADQLTPLHVITTTNPSGLTLPKGGPARLRLIASNPRALASALGVSLSDGAAALDYTVAAYPQVRGPEARSWLEATFVVDFEEPEFAPIRQELAARAPKATRPDLVAYAAEFIEASDDRSWDLASVVARRRRGDCSEHAVFTAALARLQGIPARVALGIALVSEGNRHAAFGHAWTEMYEDGKWTVADAALLDLQADVRYLPLGLLEDEGMGYGMDLMRTLHSWVERVEVLGP